MNSKFRFDIENKHNFIQTLRVDIETNQNISSHCSFRFDIETIHDTSFTISFDIETSDVEPGPEPEPHPHVEMF
jgi:hypothetical protein